MSKTPFPPTSVQIRFGNGRRRTFRVVAPSADVAAARIVIVRELAKLLVDSGRLLEAPEAIELLTLGGEDFDEHADGIRQLCAEPLPEGDEGDQPKTFRQLGEDWTSGRLAKEHRAHVTEKKSASDDVQRLEVLYETIGDVALVDFTRKHAQDALNALPAGLSTSTLRQYAQVIRRVLTLAVWPCGIIDKHPLPENFCPKVSPQPKFVCIYPVEDAELMACTEVEFAERFLYGFAVRTGLRLATILDLTWANVRHATGYVRGLAKNTKDARGKVVQFKADPALLRALKVWREQRRAEPETATIFPQWERTTISKRLRAALLVAGIDRKELHKPDVGTEPMRFHDLRASFVTFALANDRPESWIMKHTGHESSQMIVRYKREEHADLDMRDWLPLDQALGLVTAAPSSDVDDVGGAPVGHGPELAGDGLDVVPLEALEQPQPELRLEGVGQLLAPGLAGQGDAIDDLSVGDAGAGAPGPAHEAPREAPGGVASRVASEFSALGALNEVCSMISAFPSSGSTGNRTLDLRIKSSLPDDINESAQHLDRHVATSRDTSPITTRHELPSTSPPRVSALSEDMLRELAELAQQGQRWRVLAAVAADLAALEESRATRSNVTLLVDRRKASGK